MTLNEIHNKAMDSAELAFIEKHKGNINQAIKYFVDAFELEKSAAMQLEPLPANEPTRSILFRSAASLAKNARIYNEAEKMVCFGLIGQPPFEIAQELRDIYEDINLYRHLELKGIVLKEEEFQLSLSGPEIGFGIIQTEEFIKRINIIEKLSIRTAERLKGISFRQKGRPSKTIKELYEPYFSVPRAASFAVTIRYSEKEPELPLFNEIENPVKRIVQELLENISHINNGDELKLKDKIADENYYFNLLGLVKKLAPDNDKIRQIGFTYLSPSDKYSVSLTRPSNSINILHGITVDDMQAGERIEVSGKLDFADAETKKIKLESTDGKNYTVIVHDALLSDIVKPYWEEYVTIIGRLQGDKIYFEDIKKE